MWQLINTTSFAADRSFVRDSTGAEVWLVAVKGTYTVADDGAVDLADEQAPVCAAPEYLGEPGRSSLRYESDLIHTKPGTDVVLHGHAHAPGGTPTEHVDVLMKVGRLAKALQVFGDRVWENSVMGIKASTTQPFARMPIVYERAFGGVDERAEDPKKHKREQRNPAGTGFATKAEHVIGQRLPNVVYPDQEVVSWKQRFRPAGFGPIARDWVPRVKWAGTYDARWEKERRPLLPLDFDERYYRCAPEDQQMLRFLRGGEPVELYNLTPAGVLRFALPKVYLAFRTSFGREKVEHRARLHTVILEPDAPRVMMVWHTHLPCHHKEHKLENTVITQKPYL